LSDGGHLEFQNHGGHDFSVISPTTYHRVRGNDNVSFLQFLSRDAMLARYLLSCVRLAVRLSVCPSQAGVLSKRLDESSRFWARKLTPYTYIPHCIYGNMGICKTRVLRCGTLSKTPDLENFATAS